MENLLGSVIVRIGAAFQNGPHAVDVELDIGQFPFADIGRRFDIIFQGMGNDADGRKTVAAGRPLDGVDGPLQVEEGFVPIAIAVLQLLDQLIDVIEGIIAVFDIFLLQPVKGLLEAGFAHLRFPPPFQ